MLKLLLTSLIGIQLAMAQTTHFLRPASLQKGDTLAIVAPAGIIKNEASILQAVALAESWGLEVLLGPSIFEKNAHFAGTDAARLEAVQWALDHPEIKAIWCARGGYGTVRIVDDLNFEAFRKSPKWVIGYSDITVLHSHLHNLGFETLHAMMPVNMEFPELERQESVATLKKALFGEKITYAFPSSSHNRKGSISGVLVGGNLTLLESLLGSDSEVLTQGKILFIEEIGEYKYHIDRLLRSLKRAGALKNCKALLVGGMSQIKKNNPAYGQLVEELILEVVEDTTYPVIFDVPAGHDPENRALFMGRNVEIETTSEQVLLKFVD